MAKDDSPASTAAGSSRVFTANDQNLFARLSGDYNPMHIDPVASRRLLFGRPVVHGIHAVLWALDSWAHGQVLPVHLTSIRVGFRTPILVGDRVELSSRTLKSGGLRLDVNSPLGAAMTINITWAQGSAAGSAVSPETVQPGPCLDRTAAVLATAAGTLSLYLEQRLGSEMFPNAVRVLPADQVAILLAASRLVGMEAPGLHSIFMSLDLQAPPVPAISSDLRYTAEGYDDRFSLLTLRVDGPSLTGQILAAIRPPPRAQATLPELQRRVSAGEFGGERALVIGGSRGLGEVAVKALVAGGADVRFTYHQGAADADRVVAEIRQAGGTATAFGYDVRSDASRLRELLGDWHPTFLGYFATPFIFSAAPRRFSNEKFADFCAIYVEGFLNAFGAVSTGDTLRFVLHPSSSAIDELPLNMGEYAAAKSAAEILCRFLGKAHPRVSFHCPRLPRLATDQTASLLPAEETDPAETIVTALRDLFAMEPRAAAGNAEVKKPSPREVRAARGRNFSGPA